MNTEGKPSCTCCKQRGRYASITQSLAEIEYERGPWEPARKGQIQELQRRVEKWIEKDGRTAEQYINAGDQAGLTPLHYASRSGHVDCVNYLIKLGAAVNAGSNSGATPLHRAAVMGQEKVVEILINAGADPSLRDADGFTPAHKWLGNESVDPEVKRQIAATLLKISK
eukprot:Clim_evm28s224 gene=Clim_evmTU28s224